MRGYSVESLLVDPATISFALPNECWLDIQKPYSIQNNDDVSGVHIEFMHSMIWIARDQNIEWPAAYRFSIEANLVGYTNPTYHSVYSVKFFCTHTEFNDNALMEALATPTFQNMTIL